NYTLNDQITIYLKTKTNLANNTYENYKYYYNHIIKDSQIGRTKIIDIRKSDILLFYSALAEQGLSFGTIKIIHKIIHPALQLACDDSIIFKKSSDNCTKDYQENMEKKYSLTIEEEKEFLERIKMGKRVRLYYPMFAIMLCTGARISEIVGLTWDNVDMTTREVHIDHQIQFRMSNGKSKWYATPVKTSAGNRIIPMNNQLYSLFLEQKKIWMSLKKDPDFEVDGYKNFVFVSYVTGKCMYPNSIRKMMRNIVRMNSKRKVQLPNISPHILRHTACCRLAESGCDIKVLQYLMGYSSAEVTMGVYNHADIERVKREIMRNEALLDGRNLTPKLTPIAREVM
ncbi:MAG: site-specific integrase, partial [Lachnospiraceae bacterium]|nr:site-specific integrase [Lachnospiraceae bacterium]